jgi:hypothetical protein
VFTDLAVLNTIDMDFRPTNALIGGLFSHQRSPMCCSSRTPLYNLVTICDQVLFCDHHVWKGSIHHPAYLSQPNRTLVGPANENDV